MECLDIPGKLIFNLDVIIDFKTVSNTSSSTSNYKVRHVLAKDFDGMSVKKIGGCKDVSLLYPQPWAV